MTWTRWPWIPVFLESPFAGDEESHLRYVRRAMRDCIERDESPFASHALYTQPGVLDDAVPLERRRGIDAGMAFRHLCAKTVVYCDYGISGGMAEGIKHAHSIGHEIEYREIGKNTE